MLSQESSINKRIKKISFLLSLVLPSFISHHSFSQHLLIKNSGETIPYKKLFTFDDYVEVTNDKRERIKILHDDVDMYYDADNRVMRYLIPVVRHRIDDWGLVRKDKLTKMQFSERVLVGKVTLYKTEVISGANAPTISPSGEPTPGRYETIPPGGLIPGYETTYQYYAEKGDQFECVFFRDRDKSINGFDVFKTFVENDNEILKKIEDDDFKFTEKNLKNIVEEYNLRNHKKVVLNDYNSLGTVAMYSKLDPSKRDGLLIKVNDSIEYKLGTNNRPYPIRLPLRSPSKVCVVWDDGMSCRVIMPIPFETQYYELRRFAGGNSFAIEDRSFSEAEKFIQLQRK